MLAGVQANISILHALALCRSRGIHYTTQSYVLPWLKHTCNIDF